MQTNETTRVAWVKAAMDRFEGPLIRYAVGITGDVETARDVVQDTFLKLCKADRAKVDGRLAPWLYTVCRNRAIDIRRKERRMVPLSDTAAERVSSGHPSPAAVAERHEAEGRVAAALETLPENQREVIRLKFRDALSYREISEITGLSVSNVGYLLHMGIKSLRNQLNSPANPADNAC